MIDGATGGRGAGRCHGDGISTVARTAYRRKQEHDGDGDERQRRA